MIDFFHSFFLFYKLRKCTASFSSNQQQQFSRYPKLSGYTFTQCVNTCVRNNLLRVVGRYWNTEHNRYVFYYIVAYFHLRDVIL